MFYYNKMFDRDFAARTVALLSRSLCGYKSFDDGKPLEQVRCDCKYGIADRPDDELKRRYSEQNGCPELAMLEDVIRGTPKREWERIVKRALKAKASGRVRRQRKAATPDRKDDYAAK